MTEELAKAEAEKIIQEFYKLFNEESANFLASLEKRDWQSAKDCAIIHVKGILKVLSEIEKTEFGNDWGRFGQIDFESILTELERL